MYEPVKILATTDSSGDATAYSEDVYNGELCTVQWIDGDLADGVDAVLSVTDTDSGVDLTLLTLTNANTDAVYNPRQPLHDAAGAAVTFDGTNELYGKFPVVGKLKLVISSGGDTKTGGVVVYLEK